MNDSHESKNKRKKMNDIHENINREREREKSIFFEMTIEYVPKKRTIYKYV